MSEPIIKDGAASWRACTYIALCYQGNIGWDWEGQPKRLSWDSNINANIINILKFKPTLILQKWQMYTLFVNSRQLRTTMLENGTHLRTKIFKKPDTFKHYNLWKQDTFTHQKRKETWYIYALKSRSALFQFFKNPIWATHKKSQLLSCLSSNHGQYIKKNKKNLILIYLVPECHAQMDSKDAQIRCHFVLRRQKTEPVFFKRQSLF